MAHKAELQHLPREGESSIVKSEARSSLIARGRIGAASLTIGVPGTADTIFPESKAANGTEISVPVLRTLIGCTISSLPNEEFRHAERTNRALLILKTKYVAMVATDGHRLSFVEKTNEQFERISEEKRVIIPARTIRELRDVLSISDEATATLSENDGAIYFRLGKQIIRSEKLSEFPEYERALPEDNDKFVVLKTAELTTSLARAADFSHEGSGCIRMRLEKNLLRVSTISIQTKESECTIAAPYAFEPISIAFNARYLIDFLKVLGQESEVRIALKDRHSALDLRSESPETDYRYRCIVMPMRM